MQGEVVISDLIRKNSGYILYIGGDYRGFFTFKKAMKIIKEVTKRRLI